ncbi:hypothetical protein Pmar_PMAR027823 [Perkinsus marinus ATCC 50983]|uniref:Uncharacterized protein n=1 Tax=Perkinsus marinus (strain ATCC 50983 / TXsc) TaxID=423536 RepID=C5K4B9_PERM5|nr:hypothetical protein Pmar_PMAR027823 [Perkinsus marinus ATCC 50983]EER20675.1 hypothetical protein Pmar_PMAR027823 [Perkinsus marinus ATCC 50983]|eukprot:XP_002788879.1 hypothetical protein Pmar_PMAR027823 [Perkinsus marinus ATCC 50983]
MAEVEIPAIAEAARAPERTINYKTPESRAVWRFRKTCNRFVVPAAGSARHIDDRCIVVAEGPAVVFDASDAVAITGSSGVM